MKDKGTIVQQLENERDYLLEKIRLLCSEKTDIKAQITQAPAMRELLERVLKVAHIDESEMDEAAVKESIDVIQDIKALLGKAKDADG